MATGDDAECAVSGICHPQEPVPLSMVQTAGAIKVINKQPLFSPVVIAGEKHNKLLQSAERAQLPLTLS